MACAGSATAARCGGLDPAADRTVVATTIGLVVQAGDGDAGHAVAGDGDDARRVRRRRPCRDDDVRRPPRGVGRRTGTEVARFDVALDRFTTLDVVGVRRGRRQPQRGRPLRVDGSTTDLLAAPPDATLGPAVVDDAGALAVPLPRDRPTVAVWSPDGNRADVDLGLAAGTRLTGVRWSGDGAHLAVLHAPPSSGDTLGIWDVDAGRFTGHVALPNFVTPAQVAFVDADRVVLPNFDRVVAYDLAGAEIDAFPIGDSTVAGVDVAGGAAIVSRLDGTLTRWSPAPRRSSWRPHGRPSSTTAAAPRRGVDQVGLVRTFAADGTLRHRLDRWAVGEATARRHRRRRRPRAGHVDRGGAAPRPVPAAGAADLDRPQGDVSDVSIAPDDGGRDRRERAEGEPRRGTTPSR